MEKLTWIQNFIQFRCRWEKEEEEEDEEDEEDDDDGYDDEDEDEEKKDENDGKMFSLCINYCIYHMRKILTDYDDDDDR